MTTARSNTDNNWSMDGVRWTEWREGMNLTPALDDPTHPHMGQKPDRPTVFLKKSLLRNRIFRGQGTRLMDGFLFLFKVCFVSLFPGKQNFYSKENVVVRRIPLLAIIISDSNHFQKNFFFLRLKKLFRQVDFRFVHVVVALPLRFGGKEVALVSVFPLLQPASWRRRWEELSWQPGWLAGWWSSDCSRPRSSDEASRRRCRFLQWRNWKKAWWWWWRRQRAAAGDFTVTEAEHFAFGDWKQKKESFIFFPSSFFPVDSLRGKNMCT